LLMRLTELPADLADLRFLLVAQGDAREHPHETALSVAVTLPLALALRARGRCLPGLLGARCDWYHQCAAHRGGKKK
jgi:hypothetical protein